MTSSWLNLLGISYYPRSGVSVFWKAFLDAQRSKSEAGMNLGKENILGSRLLYLDVRRCHLSGKRIAFQQVGI
jgi:hypothetical protein